MPKIKITRFDGGISDDVREPDGSKFAMAKHFDIYTNPYRLTPFKSTEADMQNNVSSTGMKTNDVRSFLLSANDNLYGLGKSGAQPRIVQKVAADILTGNWNTTVASGTAVIWPGCFIEYKDFIWGYQINAGTAKIWRYDRVSTLTDSVGLLSTASASQEVPQAVIAKDDNCYFGYMHRIARNNNGTITDNVLVLPSDQIITSMDNWGNYLAIAATTKTTYSTSLSSGRSYVYLWDLVSSDVTETIDWGEGALMVLANIEGRLVGVSNNKMDTTMGASEGSLVVRMWQGGTPEVIKEIKAKGTVVAAQNQTYALSQRKAVIGNKLYFSARVPTSSSTHNEGIWCFGRKNTNSPWALTLAIVEQNADADGIQSFGVAGNYFYINHSADGSVHRTDDASNYNFTSIYESQILNGGDSSLEKTARGVSVGTTYLPAAGQVVLKYRKDAQTAWTTIFTETTDNLVGKEFALNFGSFREIQFRIESTGGAEITALTFEYDNRTTAYGN